MAHKAKYGTEDPFKNIIACTIFVCECYNGTNEKVFPQGFISAHIKILLYHTPPQK